MVILQFATLSTQMVRSFLLHAGISGEVVLEDLGTLWWFVPQKNWCLFMIYHDLSCMFIVFHPFPIFSPCHILIICCNLHVETKLFGFASNSHLGDLSTARSATPGHGLRFRSWCNKFASCLKLVGGLEHEVYFSIDCKSSSQLTNIFQRGWNHQPGSVFWGLVQSGVCLKNLCSVQSDGLSGWWSFDVPILRQNYVCLQRFTDEDLKYGRLVF